MAKQSKELQWFDQLPAEEPPPGSKKEADNRRQAMAYLGKHITNTSQWVNEIAVLINADERKDLAWNALRGVLQAIRDRLTPEEAFQLSAQLPMLIRGMFFERYYLSGKPEKFNAEELKSRIEEALGPSPEVDPSLAFKAVLLVLRKYVSEGQLSDIYGIMPKDIRQLWDDSLKAHTA